MQSYMASVAPMAPMAQSAPMSTPAKKHLIVAITGASGSLYGVRLLEAMRKVEGWETHVVVSNAGALNALSCATWQNALIPGLSRSIRSRIVRAASTGDNLLLR